MDQMVNRCRYQGYEEAYRKGKRKLNQDLVYKDLSSRAMVEKMCIRDREKGPGYELFAVMKKKLGKKKVIAEDLGFLTPSVIRLVKKTGYPGMKILQFAFDAGNDSEYLPHNYDKNCVVYTGTHDNDTTCLLYTSIRTASFCA